jgi:hypothetical protein
MAQIRGVFPFPQNSPQLTATPEILELAPGQAYVVPPGEYLVSAGSQTVIQWFDPMNLTWRSVYPPGSIEQISADGTNYRLINMSGVVIGANITNAGSGGTNGIGPIQTGTTVGFTASPTTGGLTATGYVVVGGSVPAPTITQAGTQFIAPPLVVCDPPPQGGVQATFAATLSTSGGIGTVTQVNPGAGYTSIPQFYVIPQWPIYTGAPASPSDARFAAGGQFAAPTMWAPGLINPANAWAGSPYQANLTPPQSTLGALLTGNALTGSGTLTAIVMSQYGTGYTGSTSPATVTFTGTSLGAAAATMIFSFCLVGTSITGAGTGYIVGAPAITTLGLVQTTINNQVFSAQPGRGKVVNANGSFAVESPGFGIQTAVAIGIGGGSITTLATVPAASLGGINDTSILQGMVQ